MSDGTDLRAEFLLDPSVTFLNHGSFGACPRTVFERYQAWQLELERQPVLFLARRIEGLLAEARASLGAYVGADPDDLVFVPNATTGVNLVAWAVGLKAGDEVLTTDLEYGALDLTWEHVCGDFGARYARTPDPPAGDGPGGSGRSGVGRRGATHTRALHQPPRLRDREPTIGRGWTEADVY